MPSPPLRSSTKCPCLFLRQGGSLFRLWVSICRLPGRHKVRVMPSCNFHHRKSLQAAASSPRLGGPVACLQSCLAFLPATLPLPAQQSTQHNKLPGHALPVCMPSTSSGRRKVISHPPGVWERSLIGVGCLTHTRGHACPHQAGIRLAPGRLHSTPAKTIRQEDGERSVVLCAQRSAATAHAAPRHATPPRAR